MIVTEKEAAEKWCPLYRYGTHSDGDGFVSFTNRPVSAQLPYCIGSRCMAWVWDVNNENADGRARGYCGAFGKPQP